MKTKSSALRWPVPGPLLSGFEVVRPNLSIALSPINMGSLRHDEATRKVNDLVKALGMRGISKSLLSVDSALCGVRLVTSDAHRGLKGAIEAV